MRRNEVCEARDCECACHLHSYWSHCHEGRHCRDIVCTCWRKRPEVRIEDLLPKISVRRGGIQYGGMAQRRPYVVP